MSAGFLGEAVVHVHPTLRCNLSCHHCYSSSAPALRDALPAASLLTALEVLYEEGYRVVSLSGGEPLLYRGLEELVAGAMDLGFKIHVVTNGTVITPRLEPIVEQASFVAVSFDGGPVVHDRIRGQDGAFKRAERGLGTLRRLGVPFGVACCVTRDSLPDVPWLAEFATEQEARLLSLRALAPVGRGEQLADTLALDAADRARLVLLAEILTSDDGTPVHVDLAPAGLLRERVTTTHPALASNDAPTHLSDLVNPVVVDERGQLVPFAYGLDARYALGTVEHCSRDVTNYKRAGWTAVARLLREASDDLPVDPDAYVDWYDHLTTVSRSEPRPRSAPQLGAR